MAVEHFSDVYVEPYHRRERKFCGGIDQAALSDNGRMSVGSGRFRDIPPERPNVTKPERVSGKFLYAGPIWSHFGHVMVDSLHRLWAHDDHTGIVFAGVRGLAGIRTEADLESWSVPAFVPEILRLIGVRPKQIMVLRQPAVFERLDVPPMGAFWRGDIQPFYRPYLRRYQREIERQVDGIEVPAKLYYSRRHLLKRGGILGSSYFERALCDNGFSVVVPEQLSILEQFAHILKSAQLVFDEGSAIHLTEVLNEVPPCTFMLPRRPRDNVFRLALGQRGRFEVLAKHPNISLLCDRKGVLSTAALALYRNPREVFDRMRELKLVQGTFDKHSYWCAALSDLEGCPADTALVRQGRINALLAARQIDSGGSADTVALGLGVANG